MKKVTFTLSVELVERLDRLAVILNVSRADLVFCFLEGSTYLRGTRVSKKGFFRPSGSTNPSAPEAEGGRA